MYINFIKIFTGFIVVFFFFFNESCTHWDTMGMFGLVFPGLLSVALRCGDLGPMAGGAGGTDQPWMGMKIGVAVRHSGMVCWCRGEAIFVGLG